MALGDKERAKELLEKNSSQTVKYSEENTRQIHLASNKKDGESVAFLEVPNYVPLEIEKALDIEVDELVSNRKDLPDVVLRSLYESQSLELAEAYETIEGLETDVQNLQAELAQVTSQRDNERELRIAAETALAELENLYIALSDQFRETVIELQKAIERSAQEAVERVSLEARFEAIKARLEASLLAIEVAEEQAEQAQERNYLNSSLLFESNDGLFFAKIPANNVTRPNFDGFYNDFNYESVDTLNGVEVVIYNCSQQEYNVSVSRSHPDGPNSGQSKSMDFPSSFKVSAGTGDPLPDTGRTPTPGVTSITAGFKRPGGWKEDNTTGWRTKPETAFTFTANGNSSDKKITGFKYRYERPYKCKAASDDRVNKGFQIERDVDVSE